MIRSGLRCALLLMAAIIPNTLTAQIPPAEILHVGGDVSSPRLTGKVDPDYSSEALASGVQGTVVFQIVVTDQGRASDITVLSPLGFGLDEKAQSAIEQWKFTPAMKDGKPVNVFAQVEVNFRFPGRWFNAKLEHQRGLFNMGLQKLGRKDSTPKAIEGVVKDMQDLAKQKFAPAMYAVGQWKLAGEHLDKDAVEGLALVQKAADQNYGPALYAVAIRQIQENGLPGDGKALATMRSASILGSTQAQFYLGNLYETGSGVTRDEGRARQQFKLCATQGAGPCQYRLGRLLMEAPGRRERDFVQAVAWLQLASERDVKEARGLATGQTASLTAEQVKWVATLKNQLLRK